MAFDPLTRTASERYKARIRELCGERVREVRVFGSRARGEATAESDLDLLVLVDGWDPVVHRAVTGAVIDIVDELDLPFMLSPLVMSADHFEELRSRERLLATEIDRDGIPV